MAATSLGITQAATVSLSGTLPKGRLGLTTAPTAPNQTLAIDRFSTINLRCLAAQIGYNASGWDYTKISSKFLIGSYQVGAQTLENYGFLVPGSAKIYGADAVNRNFNWQPITVRKNTSSYSTYNTKIGSLKDFLSTPGFQDALAYQILHDTYYALYQSNAITDSDPTDVIAGMMYVAWVLGVGSTPTNATPNGTGAWAWRFHNMGNAANYYNLGRYTVTVLSQ